jgi:hypothetical protein
MMRDFKFFHGIIRHGLTELSEPELNYNLNLYDDITDTLADEIRHEIDREIVRNLTGTYPYPLTGTGTITTNGDYTLTTTNTDTVDYTTCTRAINTGNLHYLNNYINMGGGNRA